jgi:hypothetical protein
MFPSTIDIEKYVTIFRIVNNNIIKKKISVYLLYKIMGFIKTFNFLFYAISGISEFSTKVIILKRKIEKKQILHCLIFF